MCRKEYDTLLSQQCGSTYLKCIETVRNVIATSLLQQGLIYVEKEYDTLLSQQCGSTYLMCIETVRNVIATALW